RHPARQPQGELGPEDHQSQHDEHDQMERDRADDDLAQFAVPDALDHEQIDPDRRRDLPELDEDDEHHAEQDRIDIIAAEHGKQQRHGDDDHPEALDQAAENGEKHQQRDVELELAEMQPDDELGHLLADAAEAQRRGEDVGGENEEQDVAGEIDRVVHRLDEARRVDPAHRAPEKDGHPAADHRRFRGGHDPEVEPPERGGDQHEKRHDLANGADQLAKRARTGLAGRDGRHDLGLHRDVQHE